MTQPGRFDDLYITVCKETGGIEGLLKSFFDFMARKTDFFYEADPGDTMGFPPGVNTQILFSIFKHFQDEHYKRFPKKDPEVYKEKLKKYKQASKKPEKEQTQPKAIEKPKEQQIPASSPVPKTEPKVHQQPHQSAPTASLEKKPEPKATTPVINTHNGGATDKYKWSQQSSDVEVTIPVPAGTVAKDLIVDLKVQHIKISFKKDGNVVMEGDLYQKISVSNSFWRIENSGKQTFIVLNLEKASERIWSTILKGDKEIDTTKVDNSKPLQDFDEETQGALRKIMYEQQRKMQGLPTTQEQQQMQVMKKAWDSQGSPFKGQPFDPSKFNFAQ